MTVRIRNTDNDVVIGVSDIVAEGLLNTEQFVLADEGKKAAAKPSDDTKKEPKKAPAKKAAAKPSDD